MTGGGGLMERLSGFSIFFLSHIYLKIQNSHTAGVHKEYQTFCIKNRKNPPLFVNDKNFNVNIFTQCVKVKLGFTHVTSALCRGLHLNRWVMS